MGHVSACFVLLSCLFMASYSVAGDGKSKDPKARKIDLSKVAEAGPGVYNIEFDSKGRIISMLAVGTSRISTVLGATKGKEVARQRASTQADAELIKFLKAEVTVYEKTDDDTILFLEGNEGNDKDAMAESGKAIERTSAKMERSARGLIRGMQVAHFEISSKGKTYILVKRWRAKTAAATKKVKSDLESDAPCAPKGNPSKSEDKKIEDKKVTIDDDD